ncbi:MAG: LytTR family DNA-binding domain-containing protein [Burkholderiales bacterium]
MSPRAIIAEDEPLLRGELRSTLSALWPDLDIVAEAPDGIAAHRLLEEHAPDVMFLDVEMPGMSGLEVARRASRRCHVVFVTAYDKYAVSAFEQGAIDYVLKPFSAARIAESVSRLRERLNQAPADLADIVERLLARRDKDEYLRWVTASHGSETCIITLDEVLYFRAENKYTIVMTAEGEALMRMPIKELSEQIDPRMFWQIHRATLVNVNAIAGVSRDFRGRMAVKLKGRKETLPVSEPYMHRFRQM